MILDDLDTRHDGVVEGIIALHDIGHNEELKEMPAVQVRSHLRNHHMAVVNRLVEGLKASPEGKGSMFDNTLILYLPEDGETHHSHGTEVPLIILTGDNVELTTSPTTPTPQASA